MSSRCSGTFCPQPSSVQNTSCSYDGTGLCLLLRMKCQARTGHSLRSRRDLGICLYLAFVCWSEWCMIKDVVVRSVSQLS